MFGGLSTGEHFPSAGVRHCLAAQRALRARDWDTAAYLAGYAVECALKSIVGACGRAQGWSDQKVQKAMKVDGHDVAALRSSALSLASAVRPALSRYALPPHADVVAVETLWRPEQRYAPTGAVAPRVAGQHMRAARKGMDAIRQAVLDGELSLT